MTVNGLNTHYVIQGVGEQTLLFLHGWGAPVTAYARVFDLLAVKYRVVAFDMPGVGGTQEPSAPLSVEDYAAFTAEFCRKAEVEECTLMCHSHGGRVAVRLLADPACPFVCRRAVFMDAAGIVPQRSAGYRLRLAGYKAAKALGTSSVTRPLFGELYQRMRDNRSSADYKSASEVMKKTLSQVVNTDMTPFMPNVQSDVLLLWGENDTATPLDDGRQMEKLLPHAGLAVIQNAGHFPFVDNWPQFSAVLRSYLKID